MAKDLKNKNAKGKIKLQIQGLTHYLLFNEICHSHGEDFNSPRWEEGGRILFAGLKNNEDLI